jgi:YHS domain-containing protein
MARLALYAGLAALAIIVIAAWAGSIRSRPRRTGSGEQRDAMVLDPVCSTYVLKSRAVVRRVEDAEVYFCSEACAARYVPHHQGDHGR